VKNLQLKTKKKKIGGGGAKGAPGTPGKRTLTEGLQRPERPEGAAADGGGQNAEMAQAKSDDGDLSFGVNLTQNGGGSALPQNVQSKMEEGLGADFSGVRIHQDGQAEKLGAQAFAVGNDLHFAQGKYDPGSQGGQELLGHELQHVVQQRDGRVGGPAMHTDGNAAVVQNPALEAEADALGAKAAAGHAAPAAQAKLEAGSGAGVAQAKLDGDSAVQMKPVIQGVIPAALAAIGSALSSATAAQAATVAGTVIAGATALTGAATPGAGGVATYQFDSWMTQKDQRNLERITQVRLINAYVTQWKAAHPEAANTTQSTTPTTTTTAPPTGGGAAPAPQAPDPAAQGGTIDQTIMASVNSSVQSDLISALNSRQRSASSQEYIWSDSGDHTADMMGTVGAIQFSAMKGTSFRETLTLSGDANQISALHTVPGLGQEMEVRQFRGGRLNKGSSFSLGYGDSLTVEVVGGKEAHDEAANGEHGSTTLSTQWNWDGNSTQMSLEITVGSGGTPEFGSPQWSGTPDDSSWF